MSKIIGIVGFIGAGKGTITKHLVNKHNFKNESFAASLKDAVSSIYGWNRELLEGETPASRVWREQVDTWWAEKLRRPNLTPRLVLQEFGTEVCRNHIHNDIWILSMERRLLSEMSDIVISDVRFQNEIQIIKKLGGKIVRVRRGPEPEWFNELSEFMKNPTDDVLFVQDHIKGMMMKYNVHPSEWSWVGVEPDFIVENDSTIEHVQQSIDDILTKI